MFVVLFVSFYVTAEHGYWYKAPDWGAESGWQCLAPSGTEENIARWRSIVLPILEQYTDSTDGSFIRAKETSVVWDYRDADPDFGAWQAKELMDHLESVLVSDPVDVFAGNCHVEIKPQGVSKGTAAEMFLGMDAEKHLRPVGQGGGGGGSGRKVDFILAIGDDRSDEETFIAIEAGEGRRDRVVLTHTTHHTAPSTFTIHANAFFLAAHTYSFAHESRGSKHNLVKTLCVYKNNGVT